MQVKPAVVSILADLKGSTFAPHVGSSGTSIDRLEMGAKSAKEMFEQLKGENAMLTWILRIVGFVMMLVGLTLMFQPIAVVADFIPFLGSLVGAGTFLIALVISIPLTLMTIATGWVFYRPLIGIPMLVVCGGLFIMGIRFIMKRSAARRAAKMNTKGKK